MAGDWIKMQHDLPEKPEVVYAAAELGIDVDSLVGKLHRLWTWFDKHTRSGKTCEVTAAFLDTHCRCAGFINALQNVGWAKDDGACISIPKFDRHNSKSAKSRALAQSRMQRSRYALSATKTAPEKRREEKRREEKIDTPQIPPELSTSQFLKAWSDWLAYRTERRLSTRDRTMRAQIASLAPLGPVAAAECLLMSIRNGWQGIFPERMSANGSNPRTTTSHVGPGQRYRPPAG